MSLGLVLGAVFILGGCCGLLIAALGAANTHRPLFRYPRFWLTTDESPEEHLGNALQLLGLVSLVESREQIIELVMAASARIKTALAQLRKAA